MADSARRKRRRNAISACKESSNEARSHPSQTWEPPSKRRRNLATREIRSEVCDGEILDVSEPRSAPLALPSVEPVTQFTVPDLVESWATRLRQSQSAPVRISSDQSQGEIRSVQAASLALLSDNFPHELNVRPMNVQSLKNSLNPAIGSPADLSSHFASRNYNTTRSQSAMHARAYSLPSIHLSLLPEDDDVESTGTFEEYDLLAMVGNERDHSETPDMTTTHSSRSASMSTQTRFPRSNLAQSQPLNQKSSEFNGIISAISSGHLSADFLRNFQAKYTNFSIAVEKDKKMLRTTLGGEVTDIYGDGNNMSPPYSCPDGCPGEYEDPKLFRSHLISTHGKEFVLCKYLDCVKYAANDVAKNMILVRHYKQYHGEELIKCEEHPKCKWKGTFDREEAAKHRESHKLRCHACLDEGKGMQPYRSAEALAFHVKKQHSSSSLQCKGWDAAKDQRCPEKFTTEAARTKHMNAQHKSTHACPYCTEPSSATTRATPPLSPDKENQYTIEVFPTEKALALHIKAAHPSDYDPPWRRLAGEKHFPCPHCERPFSRRNNLAKHILTVHSKSRSFVCNATDLRGSPTMIDDTGEPLDWHPDCGCDSGFANKQSLVDHVRTRHLGLLRWEALRRARGVKRVQKKVRRKEKVELGRRETALRRLTGRVFPGADAGAGIGEGGREEMEECGNVGEADGAGFVSHTNGEP